CNIGDQVVGGVGRQVYVGRARVGSAAPAVALVEQDDAVPGWVEEPAVPPRTAGAWTAVQYKSWLAVRIPTRFPVDEVAASDLQHAVCIGFDLGIESCHTLSLSRRYRSMAHTHSQAA